MLTFLSYLLTFSLGCYVGMLLLGLLTANRESKEEIEIAKKEKHDNF